MSDSIEDRFKRDLFERYERNKKYLIPKDVYYTMLENTSIFKYSNHVNVAVVY